MIPTTLFAIVTSVVLAVNGAVVQRDGTFTYLSPQPTLQASGGSSTSPAHSVPPSSVPPSSVPPSSAPPVSAPATSVPAGSPPASVPASSPPVSVPATVPPASTPCVSCASKTSSSTGTTTPTPPSGTANCNGVQVWQAAFAYVAGNQVIYKDQLFKALQWTYDNAPPQHPDQWSFGGVCAQPINNKVSCAGVAAWQQSVAYTSGNQVTYNGHLWSATQWTQSNAPGDASGIWKDQGACM